MTRQFTKTAMACALLMVAGSVSAQWREDDLGTDFYQQNDLYTQALNKPESTTNFYQQQVNWMLANHYPPASVILSSVSRGMTVADTVYFMAAAQPERAMEFYNLAVDILPGLPGWACSEDGVLPNRYAEEITPRELPPQPSLATLAQLYFDEGRRLLDYPEWDQDEGHVNILVSELVDLKKQDIDAVGHESWWYRPSDKVDTKVTMATFYPDSRRVVIDTRLDELQRTAAPSLPVMIIYAENGQIPLSDANEEVDEGAEGQSAERKGGGEKTEVTVMDVVSRFESLGERASPTRDWQRGDHHMIATVEELDRLFDLPELDDIPPEKQQAIRQRLQSEPDRPLLLTLYGQDSDGRFVNEPETIVVAREMEMESLPVVFFYNEIQRQPCGVPASCSKHVRVAAIIGSKRLDLFTGDDQNWQETEDALNLIDDTVEEVADRPGYTPPATGGDTPPPASPPASDYPPPVKVPPPVSPS